MYVKQVVLFGLLYLSCCYCIRIWRQKSSCDTPRSGFTCLPKVGNKKTVIIECPLRFRDYHIYINEFSGPSTLENLIIKNCKSLTILLRCSKYAWEKKNLKYLEISNIGKLKIQHAAHYQSLLPPTVVFQNIASIENIPSNTFTELNRKSNSIRCVLPNYNFQSLHFKNVSINRVLAKAFYMPNKFGNVTFTNVRIGILETSSFAINHGSNGVFLFENSTVGLIKSSAIKVVAQKTVFSNNRFVDISSRGITVKSNIFSFTNNVVDRFSNGQALAVESKHVIIASNHFKYLKTGTFSSIGDSIGGQNGHYEFLENEIDFTEDESLPPKLYSYNNVSTQISFKRNTFSCECFQSGMFLSRIEKKHIYSPADEFYKNVFDERSENICSSTCKLPLKSAKAKIVNGKCTNSITITTLCAAKKINEDKLVTTSPEPNTFPPKLPYSPTTNIDDSTMSSIANSDDVLLISKTDKVKLEATPISHTRNIWTTFVPTKLLSTESNKSFNTFSLAKSTQQLISQTTLPTRAFTIATTKLLPTRYSTIFSKNVIFRSPYHSDSNLIGLGTTQNKLETKKIGPASLKVNTIFFTPTVESIKYTTDQMFRPTIFPHKYAYNKPFTSRSTNEELPEENEASTFKLPSTSKFLYIHNKVISTFGTINQNFENEKVRLPTSGNNLTTASFLPTTLPTTRYKPAVTTKTVKIVTSKYNNYIPNAPQIKPTTLISKEETVTSDEEMNVKARNSSIEAISENGSKTYFLSSSLIIISFSYVLIFLI